MDDVKLEPLIDGQRAEDRVVEHLSRSERLLRLARGIIEAREIAAHRVEHRIEIELAGRDDVLRRLAAFREITEVDHRELLDLLFERRRGGERRAFFETTLEAFRRAGIRARQVLDDFDHRPLAGIAADVDFGAAAFRGVKDDRETLSEDAR